MFSHNYSSKPSNSVTSPSWNDHKLYNKNPLFITDDYRDSIMILRFLLFRSSNSNISSCTTSNSIEYYVCGYHVILMSIFQLSGIPYEYDNFYFIVIFYLSIHYETFVLPYISITNFINTWLLSVYIYFLNST